MGIAIHHARTYRAIDNVDGALTSGRAYIEPSGEVQRALGPRAYSYCVWPLCLETARCHILSLSTLFEIWMLLLAVLHVLYVFLFPLSTRVCGGLICLLWVWHRKIPEDHSLVVPFSCCRQLSFHGEHYMCSTYNQLCESLVRALNLRTFFIQMLLSATDLLVPESS